MGALQSVRSFARSIQARMEPCTQNTRKLAVDLTQHRPRILAAATLREVATGIVFSGTTDVRSVCQSGIKNTGPVNPLLKNIVGREVRLGWGCCSSSTAAEPWGGISMEFMMPRCSRIASGMH